jgi:hypothetical protein
MPALVASIHVFKALKHGRAWMARTSPAMTPNVWLDVKLDMFWCATRSLDSKPMRPMKDLIRSGA